MEYFDFNKVMASGDNIAMLCAANSCRIYQWSIEEKIAKLNKELKEQRDYESRLMEQANED